MSLGQFISRYVVAGTLALAAADAMAVVMTETVTATTHAAPLDTNWSTSVQIAQFNNISGANAGATLTKVEFSFTGNGEFEFQIDSPTDPNPDPGIPGPATGSYRQTLNLNLKGLGLAAAGLDNEQFLDSILSGNGGPEFFSSAPSKTVSIESNTLSGFAGTGTVLFDITATGIRVNNVAGDESIDYAIDSDLIKGQASLSVTYSFEPATNNNVPAPGALVLLGIGLVAMGISRRKSKNGTIL